MKLKRYKGNPIVRPNPDNWWEKAAIFNPAAIYDGKVIHLLPRVIGEYEKYISRIAHYISKDGFQFVEVASGPIFEPKKSYERAVEDPRLTFLENELYMTYVALSHSPREEGEPPATALALIQDYNRYPFKRIKRLGIITPKYSDNRDTVIFPEKINGKYVMLHRPYRWCREWMDKNEPSKPKVKTHLPCSEKLLPQKPSIWMAYSSDLKYWFGHKIVMEPQEWWEEIKIGGGAPPIKTEVGWLIIYHGVAPHNTSECYRVGAALLDLEDPSKVIARTKEPILEPEEEYEKIGDVNNVIFPEGNVVIGDKLFVYYGAADKVVGVATCSLNELLKVLYKS